MFLKKTICFMLIFVLLLLASCHNSDNTNTSSEALADNSVLSSPELSSPENDTSAQKASADDIGTASSKASVPALTPENNGSEDRKTESIEITEITAEILLHPDDTEFDTADFQREEFIDSKSGKLLPYRLYLPKNHSKSKKHPLLFLLHGAGERGTDNTANLANFKKSFETAGDILKQSIIIAPQCPEYGWWNIDEEYNDENGWLGVAMRLLNKVIAEYSADNNRIYVTGLSMGGYATWSVLERYPSVFAAGVPVCGWGNIYAADILKNIPIWVYHGTADTTVSYSSSEEMYNSIKSVGGSMLEFTPLYGVGHNAWDYAYTDRNMFCWLFSQTKSKAKAGDTSYKYIPVFEIRSPQNDSVITEADITYINYEHINNSYCCFAELSDDGLYNLEKAYKSNIGKKFTVCYGGEPIYTFKPSRAPVNNMVYIDECAENILIYAVSLQRSLK